MPDRRPPTVLVVDDEVLVQDLIRDVLEEGGYDVLTADDAAAALSVLEARAAALDGLITDVNLGHPGTGWDVAHRARELNPRMPVVYVTGDSSHEWSAKGVPLSAVVSKPFAPAQVLVALASLALKTDDGT